MVFGQQGGRLSGGWTPAAIYDAFRGPKYSEPSSWTVVNREMKEGRREETEGKKKKSVWKSVPGVGLGGQRKPGCCGSSVQRLFLPWRLSLRLQLNRPLGFTAKGKMRRRVQRLAVPATSGMSAKGIRARSQREGELSTRRRLVRVASMSSRIGL